MGTMCKYQQVNCVPGFNFKFLLHVSSASSILHANCGSETIDNAIMTAQSTSVHSDSTLVQSAVSSNEPPQSTSQNSGFTASTGFPITVESITWFKASIVDPDSGEAQTVRIDRDMSQSTNISYIMNMRLHLTVPYDCWPENMFDSSFTGIADSSSTGDLLHQPPPRTANLCTAGSAADQSGISGIYMDNSIALKLAEKETLAVKNRIILCGLTLTIPLFLYLRFTIWNQ